MAEHQVELGFTLAGRDRDVELLARFGSELEALAGEAGPATAIHEGRYMARLTISAEGPLEAAKLAADLYVEAMNRALAADGDELDVRGLEGYLPHWEHLQVDREPSLA
jgi:hypothetical protein